MKVQAQYLGPSTFSQYYFLFPLISLISQISWELFSLEQHADESITPVNSRAFHVGPTHLSLGLPSVLGSGSKHRRVSLNQGREHGPLERATPRAGCHLSIVSYHPISPLAPYTR